MPGSSGSGGGQRSPPSRAGGQLPRRPGGETSHFPWVTENVKKGPARNCTAASQALRPSPSRAVTCTGATLGPLGWQSRAGRGVRGTRGPSSSSRRDPEAHATSPLPTCPLSAPPQLPEVSVREWQGRRSLEAQRLGAPPHRLDAVASSRPILGTHLLPRHLRSYFLFASSSWPFLLTSCPYFSSAGRKRHGEEGLGGPQWPQSTLQFGVQPQGLH